jgi:hypothetical protein
MIDSGGRSSYSSGNGGGMPPQYHLNTVSERSSEQTRLNRDFVPKWAAKSDSGDPDLLRLGYGAQELAKHIMIAQAPGANSSVFMTYNPQPKLFAAGETMMAHRTNYTQYGHTYISGGENNFLLGEPQPDPYPAPGEQPPINMGPPGDIDNSGFRGLDIPSRWPPFF